jgi:ribosomal protein S19
MARSVWKGPFVDGYLLKKAEAARASGRHEMIRIWSRRSTILPQFVGLTFGVYNGQKHIPVMVTDGRPQVWRVLADAGVLRPFVGPQSQAERWSGGCRARRACTRCPGQHRKLKGELRWARRSASERSPTTRPRRSRAGCG